MIMSQNLLIHQRRENKMPMETNQQYQERKSLIEKILEERQGIILKNLLDMNISELKELLKREE